MHGFVVRIEFQLQGCASLKEKRQRTSGVREKLGRQPHLAIIESGQADALQTGEWTIILLAPNRATADKHLSQLEQTLAQNLDARITVFEQEPL
ncbi:conserved hypothetical protein [Hahella chejuensis KCTC 2396]|uniref:DUF503 domain-containing protein n=1 Tax=Hahella chejuensis (strain KCTC 2396) TaxID=349521 RepID=Q2SN92_HAHCH|nr:DUF503 domain-containing protein [Hahella chejuensis]ABC27882.1 conserved hypothetical protein [Hahella chejuensis KCTC 2396]